MTTTTFQSEYNAIRGFRRAFPHLADLSNDAIRMDIIDGNALNLEGVAAFEADRFGALRTVTYSEVPMLRRSVKAKGATARVRAFFSTLPAGTSRRDAIAAAVNAGFAYCTCRTQYQVWKNA